MNIFELTRALIDIPSVTGEEAEVARFLADFLRQLGYNVELQSVVADRSNIIATTSSAPHFVFSTHLDTVPPLIRSSEDAEYIHGRGACDAKGIIAAQIFAAEKLRAEGMDQVGLLFTVDEELGSVGAMAANEHPIASQCRYLINGEPTDNLLAVGTKGSIRVRLSTQGIAAHSAYPERGESAIEKLLDVLKRVRACDWPRDQLFGETTCNIGVIQGGTRPNVIPSEADAVLQLRLSTNAAEVIRALEKAVAGQAGIDYLSVHDPVRLIAVDGFEQCIVRFTTDIPYLRSWGQPLLIGPGSIFQAHTDDEYIAKHELKRAVELYVSLVHSLSGSQTHEAAASLAKS